VIGLSTFTGLSWNAALLMPDILASAVVLAVSMLAFHADDLRRWETGVLIVVIAIAIISHMSILALAVIVMAFLAVLRVFFALINLSKPALALSGLAVAIGVLLSPLSNLAITGHFSFTPGGFNFLFSRLVQDGIVQRYLADRCPDPTIRLCNYQGRMPESSDDWLWSEESPLYKLGGFEQFEPDAHQIVIASLKSYPAMNLNAAFVAAIKQFVKFATGDGLTGWNWHTQWAFERFAPGALEHYRTSRQVQAPFNFRWANLIHIPVQTLAIVLLPAIIVLGRCPRIRTFAGLVLAALLGNAVICGVLSAPHDRYQSRVAWLALLVVAVATLGLRRYPLPTIRTKAKHGLDRAAAQD
jgi:hypothetical protein